MLTDREKTHHLYIPSIQNGEAISLMLNSAVHGPCCGGRFANGVEYDVTFRFVIEFWPLSAFSWIYRCHSSPPPDVVNDIVRNGYHIVVIGHKLGDHADEWRFFFSRKMKTKYLVVDNLTQWITHRS